MTRPIDGTISTCPASPPPDASAGRESVQADEQVTRLLEAMRSDQGVQAICSEHNLWPQLSVFVDTARNAFHPVHDMRAEVDVDPDTEECRVVVDVTVDAPVAEVLHQYNEFTRSVVRAIPAEKREWLRLAFHPLRDE